MLATALRIRQFMTGQAGKVKWEPWYVPIGIKKEVDKLRTFAARELPDPDQREKVLTSTGIDPYTGSLRHQRHWT